MNATISTPATESTTPSRFSFQRVLGLSKANAILMMRNRLTLSYALIMPLFPLLFLFLAPRGSEFAARISVPTVITLAWLFPIFYNLLSMVVTRRDEKVLKRLRTGEATDAELLISMALPGVGVTLAATVIAVAASFAAGVRLPLNPALLLVAVLIGCVVLIGCALWTAAWTRTAEAAQLTSMPVIVIMAMGTMVYSVPPFVQEWARFVPGASLDELVRIAWFGEPFGSAGVGLAGSWGAAVIPALVSLAWAALAGWVGWRSMRWEPRV